MPMSKIEVLQAKRFFIRKSLIGTNTRVQFTNNKGQVCNYDHDKVYEAFKLKFDSMPCFEKYKSYTNSNNLPAFVRTMDNSKKVFTMK